MYRNGIQSYRRNNVITADPGKLVLMCYEGVIDQLKIAKELNLPVIIHSRSAFDETMDILDQHGSGLRAVVFHCFSGSPEQAKIVLDRGYYISFTGVVTFKNAELARRAEIIREKGTNRAAFLRGEVDKYTWVAEGSSYVLSEVLAAILEAQLNKAPEIDARRAAVVARYRSGLTDWAEL